MKMLSGGNSLRICTFGVASDCRGSKDRSGKNGMEEPKNRRLLVMPSNNPSSSRQEQQSGPARCCFALLQTLCTPSPPPRPGIPPPSSYRGGSSLCCTGWNPSSILRQHSFLPLFFRASMRNREAMESPALPPCHHPLMICTRPHANVAVLSPPLSTTASRYSCRDLYSLCRFAAISSPEFRV